MSKNVATLKSGRRSLKVIEDDTIQSGIHDFLLTFHSNHIMLKSFKRGFRDKQISTENRHFPTPVYL